MQDLVVGGEAPCQVLAESPLALWLGPRSISLIVLSLAVVCTAVWLHGNAVGETPVPATKTAVSAKKATVVETETEENSASLAETENEVPQQEVSQEERPEPETESIEMPADSELQPSAEQSPTKNSAPEPTPSQPPKELQPGDKVYVAGFGWVEYEGPNRCERINSAHSSSSGGGGGSGAGGGGGGGTF